MSYFDLLEAGAALQSLLNRGTESLPGWSSILRAAKWLQPIPGCSVNDCQHREWRVWGGTSRGHSPLPKHQSLGTATINEAG